MIQSYLLNPIALLYSTICHEHVHSVGNTQTTFVTDGLVSTASLLHTLKKENAVIYDIVNSLNANDIFYDVGANIGVYTRIAASTLSNGEVVAFEPHPENVTILQRNADITDDNVRIYECALADTDGTAELALKAGNQRYSLRGDDTTDTMQVDTFRCDSLVESNEKQPSVIKIDVEGSEVDVLRGMVDTISDGSCRLIYCEVHRKILDENGHGVEAVYNILEDGGYEIENLDTIGNERYIRAEKESEK